MREGRSRPACTRSRCRRSPDLRNASRSAIAYRYVLGRAIVAGTEGCACCLCACYATSGTEASESGTEACAGCLCACYAMSGSRPGMPGTGVCERPTQVLCGVRY
eukprot:1602897-Rhodomonas_salina.1